MQKLKEANVKVKEATDILVQYIKENTENNGWIIIRHRDIPKIARISQFYAPKLIEALSIHENILCELATEVNVVNKPLHFKYVTREEKIQKGATSSNFYYLSDIETSFVKSKIANQDKELVFNCLVIVNAFAGLFAKEYYLTNEDRNYMIDMLCMDPKKYSDAETLLIEQKIVIKHTYEGNDIYKLALDNYAHEKVIYEIETNDINKKPPRKTIKSATNSRLLKKDENSGKKLATSAFPENTTLTVSKEGNTEYFVETECTNNQSAEAMEELRQDLLSFTSVIKGFEQFVEEKIGNVLDKKKWLEDKEKAVESGYEALQKSAAENNTMLTKINELEAKIRKHEHTEMELRKKLELESGFNDNLVIHVQSVMQGLCAEVGNVLPALLNVPLHKKTELWNAKVQFEIMKILQDATVVAATRLLELDNIGE